MHETIPLAHPLTLAQLVLRIARGLGQGQPALMKLLGRVSSKNAKASVFGDYKPSEHDVLVTCFSKSGTNWALQLVVQIAHLGAAEFERIHYIAAWPDGRFPGIVALDDPGPWEAAPTKLRAIKTALEAEFVPYSPEAHYFCVARDPKELVVSAYYFLTGVFGMREHISPQAWCKAMLEPGSFIMKWPAHMASYWAWRERPNVLLLTYPEMKRDLAGAVDQLVAMLGVELDEAQRAEVIRRGGFEYMKAHESCFAPPRLPLLTGKSRGEMVRKGGAGGSSELLSDEDKRAIDALMVRELEALGSDFPYAELFMGG